MPVGLIALALCPVVVHESRTTPARRSYDPAGALTITGALVLFVYTLVEAPDTGWGAVQTILLFAASAALLVAFVMIESRHRAPLVPLRILRSRTLVGANAVMLLFGTVGFGMPFILTLYAQQVLGYSALKFGVGFAVVPVMAAVGMMVTQAAVLRVGFRPIATAGMLLLAAGSLLLSQVSVAGSYFGDLFWGLLVFGSGIALAFVTASIAALTGVAEHEAGLASGLSNPLFSSASRSAPRSFRRSPSRRPAPTWRRTQRGPAGRSDRGLPVGVPCLRRARGDRRHVGVPPARPAAPSLAGAARRRPGFHPERLRSSSAGVDRPSSSRSGAPRSP